VLSSQPNLQPPLHFRNADKVCHIGEYFGLGILLARAIRASMRLRFALAASLIALALGMLVGSFDEFYQSFVPGRDSSVYDLLADTIGVALAQLIYVTFAKD
jgi:VanZ family protein